MRGAFKILSIKGINLFVHWTFLLLIGWVILANVQAGNTTEQMLWSVAFILAVFACVILHEFGHAAMASRFGIKAENIVLLPIGGVASIEKFPDNPVQELQISIAGPLVNVIIAGIIWLLLVPHSPFWQVPATMDFRNSYNFLNNLRIVNISLVIFNLIPAFPMDGGRILRAILGFKFNYIQATTIAANIGKAIAIIFIVVGIVAVSPLLPIIGIFIIFSASAEEYYLRLKALVKGVKLSEVLMYHYASLQSNMTVQDAANILMSNHSKYFVLMDGGKPIGSINRLEIVKAIAEKKYNEQLLNLATEKLEFLDGDKEVDTVLEKLARNDERIYPIIINNQFAGVINLNHIIEYLLLHRTDTKDYSKVKSLVGLLR